MQISSRNGGLRSERPNIPSRFSMYETQVSRRWAHTLTCVEPGFNGNQNLHTRLFPYSFADSGSVSMGHHCHIGGCQRCRSRFDLAQHLPMPSSRSCVPRPATVNIILHEHRNHLPLFCTCQRNNGLSYIGPAVPGIDWNEATPEAKGDLDLHFRVGRIRYHRGRRSNRISTIGFLLSP